MLLAIENFKDGFVQDTFMKSKYAKNSLENTGFENIKEKPKNPQKDYLVFIDSLKKQLPSLEDNKQKAILHYEIADNYLKYLETLRKNNLNSFRQYIETNDEYYKEALRNIDKSLSLSNDENLIIDSLLAKLIIYHHQFENKKTEKIYNKLSKRIKSTIDKKESQYSKLNQVLTAMQNHGLRKYAFRLQMDNIKRLPPELAKKRLVSLKEKADRHLKNDDISEAERIYEQYLKLSKSFYSNEKIPVIYHDVAKQYFNHKKYSTACKYYNAIIDKCSNYKKIDTVQFKLALSYEKQEDYKDAVKAYEKYIKYYPGALKINEVYIKLSDLYYVIGCGSKQALSSLQKLASSAPEKARPYIIINIAKTLYNMDEFDKAKEEFEKVIKLYPDNSQSYVAKNYIDKIKERNKKE
jgi:tetratricopeptide (TPR) repeat protein